MFSSSITSESLIFRFLFLIAFIIGSIPFSLIVSRIFRNKKFEVEELNSQISLSSQLKMLWPVGFVTFLLDMFKGAFAVFLATPAGFRLLTMIFVGHGPDEDFQPSMTAIWAIGLAALLGHCFTPWLQFKGGKGLTTAFGIAWVLSPLSALLGLVGFGLTFYHRRMVSVASISGIVLACIAYLVLNPIGVHLWIGLAMVYIILIRYEANIDALLENREKSV